MLRIYYGCGVKASEVRVNLSITDKLTLKVNGRALLSCLYLLLQRCCLVNAGDYDYYNGPQITTTIKR